MAQIDSETLEELLENIEENVEEILVRDQIDGEVGNYRLSDLPAPRALHWAFRWIREGKTPHRMISEPK